MALTNSAGGLRALLTALRSENMAGVVMYENVGYVFPEGLWDGTINGPFGPVVVPLEEFLKLTRIPLQIVWGDNVDKSERQFAALQQSLRFIELINQHGGDAELLSEFLEEKGLDGYAR